MATYAEDYAEIRRLLARYARGSDRLDAELMRSVYWDDATDHHGSFKGGVDEYVSYMIDRLKKRYSRHLHCLGQSLIEVDGDYAFGETCHRTEHLLRAPDEGLNHVTVGRYVDRFAKRHGEWRILEREVVLDWFVVQPVGEMVSFWPYFGTADHNDPSYRVMKNDKLLGR
jgi:hypothetical protein